jgi:hypothetical protein
MTFVISLADYVPPARYDNHAWTAAQMQEASDPAGTWATIDTFALIPVDTDPEHPQSRDFTSTNATLTSGWYRIVWEDAANHSFEGEAIARQQVRDQNYAPTTDEVARLIISRTRDKYGNLIGVFTDETLPTAEQVDDIIGDVITDVADFIGDTVPVALVDDAQHLVAVRAAMQVELSYYAEQVNTNRSPYNQLKQHFDEDIQQLIRQIQSIESGDDTGGAVVAGVARRPVGSFPDPNLYPPYGLKTRW